MPRGILYIANQAASWKVATSAFVNPAKVAKNKREGIPCKHGRGSEKEWIGSKGLDDPKLISAAVGA
jgi:hypothetical protein